MRVTLVILIITILATPALADLNGAEITSSISSAAGWKLQSTVSIGATTVVITGGTGTPIIGDAFCTTATCLTGNNKAGHVVTAVSGTGPYTLTVSPPMGYYWYITGGNQLPSGETLTINTPINFRLTIGANAGACATPLDKTTLAFGWITSHASDSRVILGRDYVGQPEFQAYDATAVTTHCVNVTHLFPSLANYVSGGMISSAYSTVGFYNVFIGSHRSSGCSGTACDSTAFGPITPYGTTPGAGLQVFTPQAITTDPLAWDFYPVPGTHNVYRGNPLRVQMLYVQKAGKVGFTTNSNYQMVQTGAKIDGVACTMGNPPTCGSSHLVPGYLASQWNGGGFPCGIESNLICQYDAAKVGYYLFGTTGFGYQAGLMPMVQVNTDVSTALGAHTVEVTMRPYDSAGTPVGAAQAYTISFNVLPNPTPPSQTLQPAVFPAIYNQGIFLGNQFWNGWLWCNSTSTGLLNDLYPLGNQYFVYFNQYSRLWNYDGLRNFTNMAQWVAAAQAAPVDWQSLHLYTYGTIITPSVGNAGGYSYIALNSSNNGTPGNSGTSAASHPTWPQTPSSGTVSAMQVADGSALWWNIGNYASQANCATNADYPWAAWVNASHAVNMDEANQVGAFGLLMDATATGDSQTNNALTTPNRKALDYLSSTANDQHNYLVFLDFQDSRLSFYNLSNYIADEMAGATHKTEATYALDTMFNYADQITNCDETQWSVGTCLKGFYVGLTLEQITAACELNLSKSTTCDPRTYDTVRNVLDKVWTVFNVAGSSCPLSGYTTNTFCAFPYAGNGEWPLTTANLNLQFIELNNLVCDGYAWLWSKVGDNWFLPDGITTYREAGDKCFGHSYDNPNYGNFGKEFNQNRAAWNYLNWRNGANLKVKTIGGTPYAYSPLNEWPEQVLVTGPHLDTVPPYHFWYGTVGAYPDTTPPTALTGSSTATLWWNTFEQMTPSVCYALSSNMSGASCTTVGGSSSQSSLCAHAALTGTQMWNNCITITGLSSSTTYFYTVGGTDLSGNIAKSTPGTSGVGNSTFSFLTTSAPSFNRLSGGKIEFGGKVIH